MRYNRGAVPNRAALSCSHLTASATDICAESRGPQLVCCAENFDMDVSSVERPTSHWTLQDVDDSVQTACTTDRAVREANRFAATEAHHVHTAGWIRYHSHVITFRP